MAHTLLAPLKLSSALEGVVVWYGYGNLLSQYRSSVCECWIFQLFEKWTRTIFSIWAIFHLWPPPSKFYSVKQVSLTKIPIRYALLWFWYVLKKENIQSKNIYFSMTVNHGVSEIVHHKVFHVTEQSFSFLILCASYRYSCAAPGLTSFQNFCHRRGKRTFQYHCVVPFDASSNFLSLWKTFHTDCSWMWRKMGSEHGHALCAVWGFSQKRRTSHIVHTSTSHFWRENEYPQCVSAYFPLF